MDTFLKRVYDYDDLAQIFVKQVSLKEDLKPGSK